MKELARQDKGRDVPLMNIRVLVEGPLMIKIRPFYSVGWTVVSMCWNLGTQHYAYTRQHMQGQSQTVVVVSVEETR